ncbi:MAG: hypothetical protein JWM20_875 [Patescibacteria group bacterium]|nr:hypothetical protein [Patescibacteria group bacterium]
MRHTTAPQKKPAFPIITGFETTRIIQRGEPRKGVRDVLEETLHYEYYSEDLKLLSKTGISTFRAGIPWHRIEYAPGRYDWTWLDNYMHAIRELGLDPIMDPLHHTSFPRWLVGGFSNSGFPKLYERFIKHLLTRYPWAKKYTIINEPLVTTFFCERAGIWYPFHADDDHFYKSLRNVAFAIRDISHVLRDRGCTHVYIDASEYHRGFDEKSSAYAEHRNNTRFQLLDLLLGRVNHEHLLYEQFRKGMSGEEIESFAHSPVIIDVLGLDYYAHCEFEYVEDANDPSGVRRRENEQPIGCAQVAMQYAERYRLPIMISETNIRGTITDRISWFIYMYQECIKLQDMLSESGIAFHGLCWFPFIDSCDWDSLLLKADCHIDPQGVIWLDSNFKRHESEFSDIVRNLNSGAISIDQVAPYAFQPPLSERLVGFINGPMKEWKWKKS